MKERNNNYFTILTIIFIIIINIKNVQNVNSKGQIAKSIQQTEGREDIFSQLDDTDLQYDWSEEPFQTLTQAIELLEKPLIEYITVEVVLIGFNDDSLSSVFFFFF